MKLGNLIELITTISKLTGKDCGCDDRKNKLNDIELW
jgi:hypothetical protein